MTFGPYPAVITAIHDGDTVSMTIDLGFGILATTFRCRLYGINAPELRTQEGIMALTHLSEIMPVGSQVMVESRGWDKYGGRFDGRILFQGENINQRMVADGFAIKYP